MGLESMRICDHSLCNGNDLRAVVDERLRVRGARGLRVIHGSVMLFIVNANLNAATLVIAQRGVQLLRDDFEI